MRDGSAKKETSFPQKKDTSHHADETEFSFLVHRWTTDPFASFFENNAFLELRSVALSSKNLDHRFPYVGFHPIDPTKTTRLFRITRDLQYAGILFVAKKKKKRRISLLKGCFSSSARSGFQAESARIEGKK